jgi:hypothetical protein
MKLILAIPGLTWLDGYDGIEVTQGLATPALSHLLGKARLDFRPGLLSQLIALPFGLEQLNLARLSASGDGLAAQTGHWLLADPVHLRIERDQARLADVGVMQLSQDEADRLIATLNQHFAEDGLRFHAPAPGRWYVQLPAPAHARFSPLPDVVGENIDQHQPQGNDGLAWSRLLNEMQMLLYSHTVNQERESRGQTPVNSVWLWGADECPPPQSLPGEMHSDDGTMRTLAQACGQPCADAPYSLQALFDAPHHPAHNWVHLDAMQAAAQYRDAWGWRAALLQLEENWFAPLRLALQQGRIDELTLITHGPAGFRAELNRSALWKIWRRARPLASLYSSFHANI